MATQPTQPGQDRATRRHFCGGIVGALLLLVSGCGVPPSPDQISKDTQDNKAVRQLPITQAIAPEGKEIATFAGGCFWCTEAFFKDLKGVDKVVSGYTGGMVANPSYEAVCNGGTGHAEAIQITFDPKIISFRDLLHIFFTVHDPTTLNRQGNDSGTQYRSGVFTHSDAQKHAAEEVVKEFNDKKIWDSPIVTEITPFSNFYAAENYHQDYFALNPNQGYCRVVIAPKVVKFRQHYSALLKK